MGKTKNFGTHTVRFNQGIVVSGSIVNDDCLMVSGSALIAGTLHISGSQQEGLRIGKGDDDYRQIVFENNGVDAANIHLSNAENLVIMNETNGKDIQFWVDSNAGGNIQAITIKETGKVGIGNATSPSTTLHVSASVSDEYVATIENDQNTSGHVLKLLTDGNGANSRMLEMEDGDGDIIFRARADGRFGFGPDGVSSMGAGTFVVGIDNSSHTADIVISQRLQHLGDSNTYMDFPSNDNITFAAGGSEELKIASDGILVKNIIKHDGDEDTRVVFNDNQIILKAGNIALVTAEKNSSAPHEVTINDGSNNVDFVVKGNGSNQGNPGMKFDASSNRLGINGVGTPEHELHVDGGIKNTGAIYRKSREVTSFPYTVANDDYVILVAGTGSPRRIDLPAKSGQEGRILVIKDATGNAQTNNIEINPDGSENIDGSADKLLSTNRVSATIICASDQWHIIGKYSG